MIEQIISCVGSIVVAVLWLIENLKKQDILWYEFIKLCIPVIIVVVNIIVWCLKYAKLVWIKFFYGKLRVSMAYLFQIKIDDKYLLVGNSNKKYYQFPGGKYKFYDGAKTTLETMNKTEDDLLQNKKERENDIAFNINPLKFHKFIKWFESGNDREIEHNREFNEELLIQNQIPIEKFISLNFRKIRTIRTPLHRTNINNKKRYEFLSYDFLEPILSQEQKAYFTTLYEKGNTDHIKWVTKDEVEKLTILVDSNNYDENEQEIRIGEHTLWCIEGKYSKRR